MVAMTTAVIKTTVLPWWVLNEYIPFGKAIRDWKTAEHQSVTECKCLNKYNTAVLVGIA